MTYPILRFLLRHFPKDHPAHEVLELIETHHQHLMQTRPQKANTFLVLAHLDAAKTTLEWNLEEAMKTPTQTRLIFPLLLCLTLTLSAAIPMVPMPIQLDININPRLSIDTLPAPEEVQEAAQKLADRVTASGHSTKMIQETHRFPFPSPRTLLVSVHGLPGLPAPVLKNRYPTPMALKGAAQKHLEEIQGRAKNTLIFLEEENKKILALSGDHILGFACLSSRGTDVLVQNQQYRVFNVMFMVHSSEHPGGFKTIFSSKILKQGESSTDLWKTGCSI
ncbi:hypothetical protein [Deinococcus misasensis]|uniref:hypothetical protein n=1 Tax=Deinococcus misasensis TaxID=392413 RepID=UPI0005501DC1|nr:hypothetical protein [Deinococcus misasensis]